LPRDAVSSSHSLSCPWSYIAAGGKMRNLFYTLWIRLSKFRPFSTLYLEGRAAQRLKEIIDGSSFLDIGCGVGNVTAYITDRDAAVGIDLHEKSIIHAKKTFPRCEFIYGDASMLPLKHKSFDCVLISYAYHHIPLEANLLENSLLIARKNVLVVEMRDQRMLRLLDGIWDKLLPYRSFETRFPIPPDRIERAISSQILIWEVADHETSEIVRSRHASLLP
jgi:SAM-dependent methyltransferase